MYSSIVKGDLFLSSCCAILRCLLIPKNITPPFFRISLPPNSPMELPGSHYPPPSPYVSAPVNMDQQEWTPCRKPVVPLIPSAIPFQPSSLCKRATGVCVWDSMTDMPVCVFGLCAELHIINNNAFRGNYVFDPLSFVPPVSSKNCCNDNKRIGFVPITQNWHQRFQEKRQMNLIYHAVI